MIGGQGQGYCCATRGECTPAPGTEAACSGDANTCDGSQKRQIKQPFADDQYCAVANNPDAFCTADADQVCLVKTKCQWDFVVQACENETDGPGEYAGKCQTTGGGGQPRTSPGGPPTPVTACATPQDPFE